MSELYWTAAFFFGIYVLSCWVLTKLPKETDCCCNSNQGRYCPTCEGPR